MTPETTSEIILSLMNLVLLTLLIFYILNYSKLKKKYTKLFYDYNDSLVSNAKKAEERSKAIAGLSKDIEDIKEAFFLPNKILYTDKNGKIYRIKDNSTSERAEIAKKEETYTPFSLYIKVNLRAKRLIYERLLQDIAYCTIIFDPLWQYMQNHVGYQSTSLNRLSFFMDDPEFVKTIDTFEKQYNKSVIDDRQWYMAENEALLYKS